MDERPKTYSQIFDDPIRGGVVALIGEKVFSFLVILAAFADKDGVCYPPENRLARLMGISERTVRYRITSAVRTIYKDAPVLSVRVNRKTKGKALLFANNIYAISKPIWHDLITRYYSSGKYLPTEKNEEKSAESKIPAATFSPTKMLPHNDNHSFNEILRNDNGESSFRKVDFKNVPVATFAEKADSADKARCAQIAQWLGEDGMNFILSAYKNQKCGMRGVEYAYGATKEQYHRQDIKNKGAYFNSIIKKIIKGEIEI